MWQALNGHASGMLATERGHDVAQRAITDLVLKKAMIIIRRYLCFQTFTAEMTSTAAVAATNGCRHNAEQTATGERTDDRPGGYHQQKIQFRPSTAKLLIAAMARKTTSMVGRLTASDRLPASA